MSLKQDLLAIEKELWTGGPDAYREHTDDSCLVVFSEKAGVMSNDEIAQSAEEGRWRDVSMDVKGMSALADGAAVLTYECNAKRKDGEPYHALISSAYVKRPDGWKLAFHQQTPLD